MSSTLVTPLLIAQPFGFSAADPTYITKPIPVPSQISGTINQASFETGFPPATMTPEASGGLPFFGQDMNGILWMITAYCANFAAGKLSVYNTTLAGTLSGYPKGAVLANANGTGLWINQSDGNTVSPDSDGTNWQPAANVGGFGITVSGSDVTLTTLQASTPFLGIGGTLTANINVIVPPFQGKSWIVTNATAGAFTVTVKTSSGTGVVVPATGNGAPTSIYCDGTSIFNTGVSTAGLAPIASPALTGTPTVPTASPATLSNNQIANTQFTQNAIAAALTPYATKASPTLTGVPTAPTAPPGTNNAQLATTAFVEQAIGSIPQIRYGTFTCANGNVSVAFATPFPTACDAITCTGLYTGWDLGNPFSLSAAGFQYHNANAGPISYIAVGH